MSKIKLFFILIIIPTLISGCNGKLPGADARKIPYDPKERVKRNLEEGKGFRLDETFGNNSKVETLNSLAQILCGEHL